ncbi:MAG: glycoside hydrolase family 28 protein [Rhodothermales bacterium]
MTLYNVLDSGATGDGVTNDSSAIQSAIDRCTASGGGTVLLPAGRVFLSGSFELKSHVTLHIEQGAILRASLNPEHYRDRVWIEANSAEHIALTGLGTIHAQGGQFMRAEEPHIFRAKPWRPRMMVLEGCTHVRLRDLTLRESALWTVHLAGCQDVTITDLSILNDRKIPNCDGIALDCCQNVRISGCHIEAGDDCIVLKTVRDFAHHGPCENIVVSNCTLASTSAALKIGTETVNDIRNVIFRGCTIRDSSRGLGIMLRDEGSVENILFTDMTVETRYFHTDWWGAAEPIYVTAIPRNTGQPIGHVRGVRFRNILCRSENGAVLRGSPESILEDVHLDGVHLALDRWTDFDDERHDLRPSDHLGLYDEPTSGVFIQHAADVDLHRCSVQWHLPFAPYAARRALVTHNVQRLQNDGIRTRFADA